MALFHEETKQPLGGKLILDPFFLIGVDTYSECRFAFTICTASATPLSRDCSVPIPWTWDPTDHSMCPGNPLHSEGRGSYHILRHPEATGLTQQWNVLLKVQLKSQVRSNSLQGWMPSSRIKYRYWIYMALCSNTKNSCIWNQKVKGVLPLTNDPWWGSWQGRGGVVFPILITPVSSGLEVLLPKEGVLCQGTRLSLASYVTCRTQSPLHSLVWDLRHFEGLWLDNVCIAEIAHLGSPVHRAPPLFYEMTKPQKDYPQVHTHAAYKTAKLFKLPSSRTISGKSPSLVRDQENHLLPGAKAELVDESQFIYLTLLHLPDVVQPSSLEAEEEAAL